MKTKVEIYDSDSIDKLEWDNYEHGEKLKGYFTSMITEGTASYIGNVHSKVALLAVDTYLLPYTINEEEYDNSYVSSLYTHYITYSKEEIELLPKPWLRKLLKVVVNSLSRIAKKVQINKVILVNNWLLSTNLMPDLTVDQVSAVRELLCSRYPEYLIGFRSMTEPLYPSMFSAFRGQGFRFLPSRFIYIVDPEEIAQTKGQVRNTINRDKKLFLREQFEVIPHAKLTPEDILRAHHLYGMLYLQKYSYHNPQYTLQYLIEAHTNGSLYFQGLKKDGRVEGIVASKMIYGMMSNPIVGYNTELPQKDGLYRMLGVLSLEEATRRKLMLHKSAGVGRFKYDRGAKGYPEYTVIYTQQLSAGKRLFWRLLCAVLNAFAVKIVEKYRL